MSSASVEAGQTLQVTLLGYGNLSPTYTMVSGPSDMSVDPTTGIVTFTPNASQIGNVSATFTATNSVGSSTATFTFQVLSIPTVVVNNSTVTFDGYAHAATATAYGSDGVTPLAGSFSYLYAPASNPTAFSSTMPSFVGTYIVQANFTSGNASYGGGTGLGTLQIISPAQVTDVEVDGSSWSSAYLTGLQSAGLGDGGGYAIPVGSAAQAADVPWTNLNQIRITFNQAVNVQEGSLTLTGVAVPQYAFAGFTYDPATYTAVWTLSQPIAADRLQIHLASSGAAAVTNVLGDPLDGEWTDQTSAYPSGNGLAGGDFNFSFNVLPGDLNQDGIVNGQDIATAATGWLHGTSFVSTNGNAIVNAQDLAAIASHWLATLPIPSAGSAQVSAAVSLSAGSATAGSASTPLTTPSDPANAPAATTTSLSTAAGESGSVRAAPRYTPRFAPVLWMVRPARHRRRLPRGRWPLAVRGPRCRTAHDAGL